MSEEKLIKRGAEAEILLSEWLEKKVILKIRMPKPYRLKVIDEQLRGARTKEEAKLFLEARREGIHTPLIYDVDIKKGQITMEWVEGRRIKDFLEDLSPKEMERVCELIGKDIARLHRANIIHGDITTSNLFLSNSSIVWIDFGLGEKSEEIERKAVDLHVLMEVFESTHPKYKECFDWVIQEYKMEYKQGNQVLRQMEDLIKRGRYK
jgi:Kae1-associated kinase Bud32